MANHPSIEAFAITVYKKNVEDHIRRDANKLSNYMTSLVLLDRIKDKPNIRVIPEPGVFFAKKYRFLP